MYTNVPDTMVSSQTILMPYPAPSYYRDTCSTIFTAALIKYAEIGNHLDVHQWMFRQRKCGTFKQWDTAQPLKNKMKLAGE